MKITSVNNDLIKETAKLLQKKYREESSLFLLEGEKCVNEAIEANLDIVHIFSTEGFESHKKRIEVTEQIMSKISDAKTPPKVVAVARQLQSKVEDLQAINRVVLLEGIKDAGNLGTILRAGAAFGIDAVILYGNTVDLYNPKCVRSAVGNLWKIQIFTIKDFSELQKLFGSFERIATLPNGNNIIKLNNYNPDKKTLIMFGSEADGLSDELKRFATKNITIEMSENVESLNLSLSVGIILYKLSLCQ